MKNYRILGIVLMAGCILSAMFAVSASAETTLLAEWLINGTTFSGTLQADTEGETLFEEMKNKTDILCSGLFEGSIGQDGEDEIFLVEDLEGNDVTANSAQRWVNCLFTKPEPCEASVGALVMIFPLGLPWRSLLVLVVEPGGGEPFVDLLLNEGAGYLIECTVLSLKADISCVGRTGSSATNGTSDVIGEFSEANERITPKAKCTTPLGEGEGLLAGTGLLTSTGGSVTVDSE